jgi:hypothetical protein
MHFFVRDQSCGRSVYHSERSCQLVPRDVELRHEWVALQEPPKHRAHCNNCAALSGTRTRTAPTGNK